jgi:hypothetical protein
MNAKITSEYAALVENSSKPFLKTGLVDKEYVAVPEVAPLSLRLDSRQFLRITAVACANNVNHITEIT